jgi:hypothetical protein
MVLLVFLRTLISIVNRIYCVKVAPASSSGIKGMKRVYILALLLIAVLLIAIAASLANRTQSTSNGQANPVYVGVAFGGNNTEQAKLLIDRVKSYTNLFILA